MKQNIPKWKIVANPPYRHKTGSFFTFVHSDSVSTKGSIVAVVYGKTPEMAKSRAEWVAKIPNIKQLLKDIHEELENNTNLTYTTKVTLINRIAEIIKK